MRHLISFGILTAFLVAARLWGQAPAFPSVQRDPNAISLLTQSVAAMSTANAPALSDLLAEGTCTQWNGADESASFAYSQIGNAASHFEVHLPDSTPSWTINAGRGSSIDKKGQRHFLPARYAAKGNWYIPITYMVEAIADASVSVSSQHTDQNSSNNEDLLVLTPAALPGSTLEKNYRVATQHVIHLDRNSHLVTQVDDRAFFATNLNYSVSHSLRYSDYREESGWLMPHLIEEYFGQGRVHAFTISHFTINASLPHTPFVVSR